jgi:hypothetical protein
MQVLDIAVVIVIVIVMVLVALGLALFVRLVSIITRTNVSGMRRRWRSSSPVPASGAASG